MITNVFILAGLFMGWSLGSNDAANAFGTAVATGVVKFKTAITVIAVFVVVGAFVSGSTNIVNLQKIATSNGVLSDEFEVLNAISLNEVDSLMIKNVAKASIILFIAGMTVFVMTYLKYPVSATQSTVGAIIGWGMFYTDYSDSVILYDNLKLAGRFALGWFLNPCVAILLGFAIVKTFNNSFVLNVKGGDKIIKVGYVIAGILASYSMGANSSSNVTALYYDGIADGYRLNLFENPVIAVTIGGIAMSLGVITYSKKVMLTVGEDIVRLTKTEGFLTIIAMSLTIILIENTIKIPVSTSQAIVGAVVGAGLTKGRKTVNFNVFKNISLVWITSPFISGIVSYIVAYLCKGFFN